ncbi:RluA family pseudouridine synthase [bacterium]|nr:MAG: RluA family pseudouridine synthase [bacterium]
MVDTKTRPLLPMSNSPTLPIPYQLKTAPGQHPVRIDRYLQQALPSISRNKIHELIDSGLVFLDGEIPRKSQKISGDQLIEIHFREQPPSDILAEAIELDIYYEDAHLLVVNKPSGMVTHPAHGNFSGTLVNALLHHFGQANAGHNMRPGIVHRLDKGTSGLLVIAKNDYVHRKLTDQFAAREVKREYRAVVWGKIRANEGMIETQLGRHPGDRKRFAVVRKGGKHAVTTYQVIETFRDTSYLALHLKTGRTHQIRVHLQHQGNPVFGDDSYGGKMKRISGYPGARKKFYTDLVNSLDYFALHARTLGFVHPIEKKTLEFEADPPRKFLNVLNKLRMDANSMLDNN